MPKVRAGPSGQQEYLLGGVRVALEGLLQILRLEARGSDLQVGRDAWEGGEGGASEFASMGSGQADRGGVEGRADRLPPGGRQHARTLRHRFHVQSREAERLFLPGPGHQHRLEVRSRSLRDRTARLRRVFQLGKLVRRGRHDRRTVEPIQHSEAVEGLRLRRGVREALVAGAEGRAHGIRARTVEDEQGGASEIRCEIGCGLSQSDSQAVRAE
mmetsp:Transcript_10991/g.23041  ORF Transcript_10991/g.23041 Transcript_10991/m.23041 type:complete len:214 (+) Transcript_10991:1160-1801(+)